MDQLLALLQSTLDPNPNARVQAELQLSQLSTQSETALALARITTEASLELHIRQAAGFALKKYVKEFWSPFFTTFKGPVATSTEVKAEIRSLIFAGLSDPVRKMRLACAVIISDIAHPDWPDDWPTLMSQLLALVGPSSPPDAVDGGMRVLLDFVGIDLTEDQLLPIAREMLPQLLNILGSPQTHSPATRARSILVFRQCVMTLFTVKDEHPQAVKAAIGEILPQWIDAFRQLLELDVVQELQGEGNTWEGLAIRKAIYDALEVILNSFPSTLKASLPHFLSLSINHLTSLLPIYHTAFLSSTSDFDVPSPAEEDSQVPSDLPGLAATIVDFLCQACRRKNVKGLFVEGGRSMEMMERALDSAMAYAQMTTDDEDSWASDPNAFVADEDDEMIAYNTRAASIDLTTALVDAFETTALSSLWSAFQRRAAQADAARAQGDADWWKGYESALAIVGAVSTDLLVHVQETAAEGQQPVFDLGRLFTSIIPTYLTASDLPFLQGRSFVFASQFSQALPAELANQYIDAAIQVLGTAEAGVPVKVSAVRALNNFFRHLKDVVEPSRAAQTLGMLLPLLPQTTENTLVLVIETIESTLKVGGPSLDQDTCSTLVKMVLETWFAKPEDPMLGVSIGEVFSSLSAAPSLAVQHVLLHEALPHLTASMAQIRIDPFSPAAAAAMDIVDSIFDGRPSPMGEGLFAAVAPTLFEVLSVSEDRDIVQTGLNIITSVVRKDVDQLLNWRSEQGQAGLELVLAQVAKLLEPSQSEAGGLFVGDLVIHLIRKAGGALGPVLPQLLEAFVNRLTTAKTASFSQSLILPFAYLVHTQLDTVISLLEGITVPPQGSTPAQPALHVLLSSWCDNVDVFQGFWNLKVSTVAMTQLYLSQRPSLQQTQVKGDMLLTAENTNTIMTRTRAKNNPDQFPPIPFPAKALKILLHDAQNAAVDGVGSKLDAEDAESDDGDDEWADEGGEFASGDKDLDFLSGELE
ncbi:ARM repeat-containing protein [Leucosporidium creatinivorum]|uniref:ARM repeat-containing protein n=1 Tax=Leucosporidium creatinivorum TaxID=106004 RepID=A0A1Y2EPX7_9BASI|nr:ARM repeat-containing protein [Leucosporidium creatinivorum]